MSIFVLGLVYFIVKQERDRKSAKSGLVKWRHNCLPIRVFLALFCPWLATPMPVHQECTYTLVQGQPENPITVTTAWKKASVSDVEIPVYIIFLLKEKN